MHKKVCNNIVKIRIRYRPKKYIPLKLTSFDAVVLADSKNVIFVTLRAISVEIAACVVSECDVTVRDSEVILLMLM